MGSTLIKGKELQMVLQSYIANTKYNHQLSLLLDAVLKLYPDEGSSFIKEALDTNTVFRSSKTIDPDTAFDLMTDYFCEIRDCLQTLLKTNQDQLKELSEIIADSKLYTEIGINSKEIEIYLNGNGDQLPLFTDNLVGISLTWYTIDQIANSIKEFAENH